MRSTNLNRNKNKIMMSAVMVLFIISHLSCQESQHDIAAMPENELEQNYKLPNIDLNHWKVTLPIGKPTEVEPPEILDYATNEVIKPFMYNDSVNGALVFYAYPGATTANTSYSRTELREQMVAGDNNVNWTFAQGGKMKGELSMAEVSKDNQGKYHRSIIMQIHGRLTNEQKELINAKDNNAPPILKIYWDKGKIRVKTKELKDVNASDTQILHTDAWGDDEGYYFPVEVGFDKFTLEVIVSEGRLEVILNNKYSKIYESVHMKKWGVFENYFKAGNYLATKDNGAYAKVKYYNLTVNH